ncbi:unnamed protein product [Vicia faba]|uniref:Uncharacterized protein n=1 Tax=Vicia faba TaxID=3906 RepID=A0AAV0ZN08_VICFA|nr:unnamed protein product [Vicia faba]
MLHRNRKKRNNVRVPLVIQFLSLPTPHQSLVSPLLTQPLAPPNPIPVPIADNSEVPWEYNNVYIRGKKVVCPSIENKDVTNIARTSRITQSGKVFAATPPPPEEVIEDIPVKDKWKRVVSDSSGASFEQQVEQLIG